MADTRGTADTDTRSQDDMGGAAGALSAATGHRSGFGAACASRC